MRLSEVEIVAGLNKVSAWVVAVVLNLVENLDYILNLIYLGPENIVNSVLRSGVFANFVIPEGRKLSQSQAITKSCWKIMIVSIGKGAHQEWWREFALRGLTVVPRESQQVAPGHRYTISSIQSRPIQLIPRPF